MKLVWMVWTLVVLEVGLLPPSIPAQDAPNARAMKIGQPSREKYPADTGPDCWFRSVCDLHTFRGRIYVGSGWIGAQKGSTYLWSFGVKEVFKKHFSVSDEQVPSPVGSFHVYDRKLVFTGGDPMGKTGTLFLFDGRKWRKKYPCIPNVHKCGDVALFKGDLYVIKSPFGYSQTGQDLVKSANGGKSCSYILRHSKSEHNLSLVGMAVFDDFLLVWGCRNLKAGYRKASPCAFRYRGKGELEPLSTPLYASGTKHIFPSRIVRYRKGILFTARANRYSTDISPCPLYFLDDFQKGAVLVKRFESESVFDVLVRDKTCHVLTASREGDDCFRGRIHTSPDLKDWTEAVTFTVKALPFSFELLKGRYYVGLGNRWHVKFADAESGSIYRIERLQKK